MSNEDLVQRYNNGEYTALDELTRNNMKLIQYIANKYTIKCSFIDHDDLVQQGWMGFIRAVETYNANLPNPTKFSTWAVYWIRQSITRFLTQKTPEDEISLYEPVGINGEATLIDTIEDRDNDSFLEMWHKMEIQELRNELETLMDRYLTLQQKEVLKLRYGWNNYIEWTLEDIGKLFNLSRQGAYETHKRALMTLRRTGWARRKAMEMLVEKGIALQYNNPILSLMVNSRKEKEKSMASS